MVVTCAPRLRDAAVAFEALVSALQSLEWPGAEGATEAEVHVDADRYTATAVLGETRVRAVLTPAEGLIVKNPTAAFADPDADPVAAAEEAPRESEEPELEATPVVRLVWIGGARGPRCSSSTCTRRQHHPERLTRDSRASMPSRRRLMRDRRRYEILAAPEKKTRRRRGEKGART